MAWAHVRSMTISIQDVPIKRAYAHADGSLYINVKAFYLLARSLGMATPLGRWIVTWYAKLEGLGVPPGQLVASSAVPGEMTVYCVTARALLSLLVEIAMARQTRPPIRAECLRVLQVLDSWGCHFDKPNVTAIVSAHGVEVPCIYARGQGLTNLFQILSLFDERGWVREEWDRARAPPGACGLLEAVLFFRALRHRRRQETRAVESAVLGLCSHIVWTFLAEVYPCEHDVAQLPIGERRQWDPELVCNLFVARPRSVLHWRRSCECLSSRPSQGQTLPGARVPTGSGST